MKNNKGVTLVALVVTIIVLIILAGISINLILGDNGIITIAKKAKENTELARIEEETQLNELYTQLETGTSGNLPYASIAKIWQYTETSDKYDTTYNITTDDMSKYNNILLSSSWDWTKYANTSEVCIIPISEFKKGQTYRVDNYNNGSICKDGYAEITYVSDTTIALKRGSRSAAIIFFL